MQQTTTHDVGQNNAQCNDDRVLYVEADALLRSSFARALLQQGLDVDLASSRSEALSFAERNAYPVIVTDLFLSEADGLSLAQELRSVQPNASFIITTGLDVELCGSGDLDEPIACFLKKPWNELQLSAAVDRAREAHRVRASQAPGSEQRYSVLLIEDNAADAYFTALLLERGKVCSDLTQCTRVEQALAMLRAKHFDAIIADLGLPDGGELATLERLRALAPESALIVLSGHEQEVAKLEALRHGAEDYLVKGRTDVERLRRSVREAVESKRQARRLRYVAQHDSSTHLINRETFVDKLQTALQHVQRAGQHSAVMALGLHGLPQRNDTHDREARDSVLCEIARRIQASVREQDTVACVAADEFAILVEELDDPQRCGHVAQRLVQIARLPVLVRDGLEITLQPSVGVALCSNGSVSAGSLLDAAASALRIAKTRDSGYHVHTVDDDAGTESLKAV